MPGNSGKADSLSVQVAQRLAAKLGARFADVLIAPATLARRRSHPRKSSSLLPYELRGSPSGLTVLVDDVASSGRHMELDLKALRENGVPTIGFVWIST